jgi:hypothetical protein
VTNKKFDVNERMFISTYVFKGFSFGDQLKIPSNISPDWIFNCYGKNL